MRPKINFITLAVTNLEKSVDFYKHVFGFPTEGVQEGYDDHCLFELEDDFSLVLYRRKDFLPLTAHPNQTEKSAGFMLSHSAQNKEEVNQFIKSALSSGATQIGHPLDEEWGYSVSIADPDGHQWEILSSNDGIQNFVIEVQHEFKAKATDLFSAWTDEEKLQKLFGLSEVSIEAKRGGRFRFATDSVAESPGLHIESGEYLNFIPGKLLVMSWNYEGPLENNRIETQLTLSFREQHNGITKLILKEEGASLNTIERRNMSRYKWTVALAEIKSLL